MIDLFREKITKFFTMRTRIQNTLIKRIFNADGKYHKNIEYRKKMNMLIDLLAKIIATC